MLNMSGLYVPPKSKEKSEIDLYHFSPVQVQSTCNDMKINHISSETKLFVCCVYVCDYIQDIPNFSLDISTEQMVYM